MEIRRGVAICHFNRHERLGPLIDSVQSTVPEGTRIVICDDGSFEREDWKGTRNTVEETCRKYNVLLVKGPNRGVAANKNRALWALQDCHFLAILEDDLFPIEKGWFETYEEASRITNNHHFCRVQDREVDDTVPSFSESLRQRGFTPIFAPTPRGDFTFTTSVVVRRVGAFNPRFRGAGFAHGDWSNRVARAGLISHPNKWWDIREARDKFEQRGDTEGGRWLETKEKIQTEIRRNKVIAESLKEGPIFHPLVLE